MNVEARKTAAGWVLLAWLVVGVPAGWGVYNTVLNARKLFVTAPIKPGR